MSLNVSFYLYGLFGFFFIFGLLCVLLWVIIVGLVNAALPHVRHDTKPDDRKPESCHSN